MKKGILPVGQIYDSQYEINWIPTPSSFINELSSDKGKKDNFFISHPSPGLGKMKKNNQLMSEPSIFIPELDPSMLNDFKENLASGHHDSEEIGTKAKRGGNSIYLRAGKRSM